MVTFVVVYFMHLSTVLLWNILYPQTGTTYQILINIYDHWEFKLLGELLLAHPYKPQCGVIWYAWMSVITAIMGAIACNLSDVDIFAQPNFRASNIRRHIREVQFLHTVQLMLFVLCL